jgi:thiol-disulfide isomerase/thioredoxin
VSGAASPAAGAADRTSGAGATSTDLVGPVTRERIEEAHPTWKASRESAPVEADTAQLLRSTPPGAEVIIVLGTWCGDSRREVPRLWRAIDMAGGNVPFSIKMIGVGRDKTAPGTSVAEMGIRYVPTFIVRRNGREVGRIVESAPAGIERSLLDLLMGTRTGLITGRTDL